MENDPSIPAVDSTCQIDYRYDKQDNLNVSWAAHTVEVQQTIVTGDGTATREIETVGAEKTDEGQAPFVADNRSRTGATLRLTRPLSTRPTTCSLKLTPTARRRFRTTPTSGRHPKLRLPSSATQLAARPEAAGRSG